MWPIDQRLEGGMMTYRGRGHIKVKGCLLVLTNSENKSTAKSKTTAMTEQLHGNRKKATALQKPKQKPWQQHGSKVITLETAWDSSITAIQQNSSWSRPCYATFIQQLLHGSNTPTKTSKTRQLVLPQKQLHKSRQFFFQFSVSKDRELLIKFQLLKSL